MAVQWLGLCAFTAEGLGSIPGQGTKIPQAKKKEKKAPLQCESIFNNDHIVY